MGALVPPTTLTLARIGATTSADDAHDVVNLWPLVGMVVCRRAGCPGDASCTGKNNRESIAAGLGSVSWFHWQ